MSYSLLRLGLNFICGLACTGIGAFTFNASSLGLNTDESLVLWNADDFLGLNAFEAFLLLNALNLLRKVERAADLAGLS